MIASFNYRKARRERVLKKMCAMRAAKERKRMENPVESEPHMTRWHRFEFRVRDRLTGEVSGWYELDSVRHATRRLSALRLAA